MAAGTTALAISTGAAAQSAAAAAQAHAARVTACQAFVPNYHHAEATVEQRQAYAGCISLLHPQEVTGSGLIAIKVLVVLVFVGIGFGLWRAKKDRHCDDWMDYAMFAFFGGVGIPFAAFLLALLGYGLWFLVNG